MALNPDSMCAGCANCIPHEDHVDYLCSEGCMEGRLSCPCYRPRPEDRSRVYALGSHVDTVDEDLATLDMMLSGRTRDRWYDFLSNRTDRFVFEDGRFEVSIARRGVSE